MTFVLPAANNLHNVNRSTNSRFLADINSPSNTGTKTGGNLPITNVAGEWDGNSAGATKGVQYEFQAALAAWDVSVDTRLMVWHHQFNAPNRIQIDTVANAGVEVRIYSGSGVPPTIYKAFYLGGNDTPFGSSVKGSVPYVIDLNDVSNDANNGSFDNTDVKAYAILTTRLNMVGSSSNWNYMPTLYIFTTTKSSASTPTFSGASSNLLDAVDAVQGTSVTTKIGNWVRRLGSVVFIDVGFRIGNNSTVTTFNDNGLTIVSPPANSTDDPRNRLTTQACRVWLNLRANVADSCILSGTWIWGTRATFDFSQSTAIVQFNGTLFTGMGDFTITGTSVAVNIVQGCTFDDVGIVSLNNVGAKLDGSTFSNPFGAAALRLDGIMDITDMAFSGYTGKTAVRITTEGAYTFSNCSFDGTGDDIENTANAANKVNYGIANQDGTTALDNANQGVGQSWNSGAITAGDAVSSVWWHLSKTASPTGEAICRVYAHSGLIGTSSVPTGPALAVSQPLDVSTLTGTLTLTKFQFNDEWQFAASTDYVITIEYSGGTAVNFVNVGHDQSAPVNVGNLSTYDGSTWTANSGRDAIHTIVQNGIVTVRAESGSNPVEANLINTGSPEGIIILLFPVNLTVNVKDSSGAAIQNARVAIFTDDANRTQLMNEDTLVSGQATQEYFFDGNTNITVRVRESPNTTSGRFIPFFTTGVITSTGYTLDVILQDDNIATVN